MAVLIDIDYYTVALSLVIIVMVFLSETDYYSKIVTMERKHENFRTDLKDVKKEMVNILSG